MKMLRHTLTAVLFSAFLAGGLAAQDVDFQKARAILQKRKSGQKLTKEESNYLRKAMEARQSGNRNASPRQPSEGSGEKFNGASPLIEAG